MRDTNPGVLWTSQPLTQSEQFRILSLIFGDTRPAAVTS